MGKKVSIGFGILAIVFTALLVVPRLINLNSWKPEIERRVSEALGRPVSIDGRVEFHILPFPGISLTDVRVANKKWGQHPEMMTANEVTVTVSLLPLFTRTLELSQIKLIRPIIHLEVSKEGKGNWEFSHLFSSSQSENESPSSGWTFKKTIPRINILEGSLTYRDQSGKEFHITHFQAFLKSNSVQGPFELKGQLDLEDKKLKYDLTMGLLTNKESVPVNLHIIDADQRLQVIGKLDLYGKSFKGQLASKLQPIKLLGNKSPIKGNLNITGDISADQKGVEVKKLSIRAHEMHAKGSAKITYNHNFSYFVLLEDLPGQTSFELKAPRNEKAHIMGEFTVKSLDFPVLLSWAVEGTSLPSVGKVLDASGLLSYESVDGKIAFKNMSVSLDDKSLSGDISINMPVIRADLTTPNVGPWLKLVEIEAPSTIGKASFKGEIEFKERINLNADLQFAGGYIKTKGHLTPLSKNYNFDMALSYPDLRDMGRLLGADLTKVNLGAGDINFNLSGTFKKISISNMSGNLGPQNGRFNFKGAATVNLKEEKPTVLAHLTLGSVNVDRLLVPSPKQKNVRKPRNKQNWSKERFNFHMLNEVAADIDIKVDLLLYGGITIKKLRLPISTGHGSLKCSPINGKIDGGLLKSTFFIATGGANQVECSLNLIGANFGKFISFIDGQQIKGGTLDADIKINSSGDNLFDIINRMNGYAHLTASNGTFVKFDVENLVRNIKSLKDPKALLGLFQKSSGQTKFSKIIYRSTIRKGVAKIDTLRLDAPLLTGDGGGVINFPEYTLDAYANIKIKPLSGAPDIKIRARGNLGDPSFSYDVSALQGYLFQKVGGSLINRFLAGAAGGSVAGPLGAIVGGAIGITVPGTGSESKNEGEEEGQKKPSPAKAVKKLLNKIF